MPPPSLRSGFAPLRGVSGSVRVSVGGFCPSVGVVAAAPRRSFYGFVCSELPFGLLLWRRLVLPFGQRPSLRSVAPGPVARGSWSGGAPTPRPPSPRSLRSRPSGFGESGVRFAPSFFFGSASLSLRGRAHRTSPTNIGPDYSYHSTFA